MTRSAPVFCVAGLLLLASPALPAQTPPPDALQRRFSAGLDFVLGGNFAGDYASEERDRTLDGGGAVKEQSDARWQIHGDGRQAGKKALLSAHEDGRDVTEARRREMMAPAAPQPKPKPTHDSAPAGAPREVSVSFRLPFGPNAKDYLFGVMETEGNSCRQAYGPPAGLKNLKGYLRGTLVWRCATLEPVSMTGELLDRAWYLKSASGRIDYQRIGEIWVARTMAFTGEVKILFYHRIAEHEVRYTDFAPSVAPVSLPSP